MKENVYDKRYGEDMGKLALSSWIKWSFDEEMDHLTAGDNTMLLPTS